MRYIYICVRYIYIGNDNPLQYSSLENPTDRRTWQATVHSIARVRHDWANKHAHICVCVYMCIFFFLFFSIMVYHRLLSIVPVWSRALFIHPVYHSLHLLIPHSHCLPPIPSPTLSSFASPSIPGQPCLCSAAQRVWRSTCVLIGLGHLCFLQRQKVAVSLPFLGV